MIKLLAVDMDGTCLDSKGKMSDKTLDALKKAAQAGITVVPTTGRNLNCLPAKIKNEDFYRYVISSNGSQVIDRKDNSEVFKACIDSETAVKILDGCRHRMIFIAAHMDREYYVQGRFLEIAVRHVLGDDAPTLKRVKNMAKTVRTENKEVEEFQLFYLKEMYREVIKKIVSPFSQVCSAHTKGYAEIYNKSGSKGTALLALAEKLGISPGEIACIGDEENDITMFQASGTGFAMGNAIDEIKSIADIILPTNNEDGVAEAINKYILKQ